MMNPGITKSRPRNARIEAIAIVISSAFNLFLTDAYAVRNSSGLSGARKSFVTSLIVTPAMTALMKKLTKKVRIERIISIALLGVDAIFTLPPVVPGVVVIETLVSAI